MDLRLRMMAAWLLLIASGAVACACNVPVFRYALDHWRPDKYRAVLLHRGPLSTAESESLFVLQQAVESRGLNMSLQQIDVDSLDDKEAPVAAAMMGDSKKCQLLIHYPVDLDIREPALTMDLHGERLEQLIDSPIRRELLKRLANGQSTVWLFVASGDEAADKVAKSTLESELQSLATTLELPKLTDDPEDKIQGGPELRIEFSVLELSKEDDREWSLRSILIGSEPDLRELKEPMAFPVFGSGRALWPLVGAGISAQNIREAATFATGACSCQVKEQNPGFDLLLSANWDELLPWTKAIPDERKTLQVAETVAIPPRGGPAGNGIAGSSSVVEVGGIPIGPIVGVAALALGALVTVFALLMPKR